MLPDNHCEVITLSDDDGGENGNDAPQQLSSQRNSINVSQYQHSQLRQQIRDRLKRANNDMQMAKQQRFTPQATGGGVSLSIINERPLDMKKLMTTRRSLVPTHQLPPTPSQRPLTVKDQLIMFFQQQHKVHLKLEQKKATTSTVRNENGLSAPFKNKISVHGLKRPIPEWRAQYNGPPSRTTHTNKRTRIDMPPQYGTLHIPSNNYIGKSAERYVNGKRMASEMILRFCNTYIEASNKRVQAGFGVIEEEFTGQFQCTFQSCNKRLKNNVMFMYHIWAHLAQQKPAENEEQCTNLQILLAEHNGDEDEAKIDDQRTDVSRLHTCPECLLEQPTPYRARLHYHRVHKRGNRPLLDSKPELHVCNICEQVIDTKNMQHHIVAHALPNKRDLALPYGCRFGGGKCQFRTSNRGALLQHFCKKHVGTHVVLCPFCLMTFCVPPTDKRDSLVRMRDFVRHMIMHDAEKSRHCGHCVIRVAISQRTQMEQHQEQHTKNGEHKWLQWHMERLNLNSVGPEPSHALISSDMVIQQCVECGQMVNNLCRHLGIETKRCNFCSFVTRCARAMDRHRLLSQCNPSNAVRRPFAAAAGWTFSVDNTSSSTFSPSSSSPPLQQFGCAQCTFCSVSVQALAEHIAAVHATCSGAQVLLLNNGRQQRLEEQMMLNRMGEDGQGGDKMEQDSKEVGETLLILHDELHEAELFGLLRMADVPLENNDDHDDEEGNDEEKQQRISADKQAELRDWLSEFLPLVRANELSQREIQPQDVRLLKQLMEMDDRSDISPDEEERAQMIAEEKHELHIKMGLMHDDFPKLDFKTISGMN